MRSLKSVCVFLLIMINLPAVAQEPEGRFARIVVLRPREGMKLQFEAGYKRHLEWHRQNNDPWTWLGWTFFLSDRGNLFIDGTFGRTAEELDRAVAPAADAADNAANVSPYAEFLSHGLYKHVAGTLEPPASPFLEMNTVAAKVGREGGIEGYLRLDPNLSAYRLVAGGPWVTYVVFRPRASWTEVARAQPLFARMDVGNIRDSVERVTVEVLRYRADMSYRASPRD